jgi:hypothetical protein
MSFDSVKISVIFFLKDILFFTSAILYNFTQYFLLQIRLKTRLKWVHGIFLYFQALLQINDRYKFKASSPYRMTDYLTTS